VEAYVLDRTDLDLYGEQVALELVARLRPTERFGSADALGTQMQADVESCRSLLGQAVVPVADRHEPRGVTATGEGGSAG
jgi:riboflavin kinase/FMN adenylyltransferase